MNAEVPPEPTRFGWAYIGWAIWTNLITILMVLQAAFASLTLANDLFTKNTERTILLVNAILTAIIAQIKRNNPPSPPPTKSA